MKKRFEDSAENYTANSELTEQETREFAKAKQADHDELVRNYINGTGHAAPVTRREFLASGAVPFAAYMMAPTILNVLSASQANAKADEIECPSANATLVPFVHIHLSGGMAMSANLVPGGAGGIDSSPGNTGKMGLGKAPKLTKAYGGANFHTNSGFFTGMNAKTGLLAKSNTTAIGVWHKGIDDNENNAHCIAGMLAKAGLSGGYLPYLGNLATPTGLATSFAKLLPSSPLRVGRPKDIVDGVGLTGRGLASLTAPQKANLFDTINKLSETQAGMSGTVNRSKVMKENLYCATIKNRDLAGSALPPGADIRALTGGVSPKVQALWGVAAATSENNQNVVFGSMTTSLFYGLTGSIAINLGGYDYHNNDRGAMDVKDTEAGDLVGKVLETAALLNKKVMIYVTSDGSVSFNETDDAAESGPAGDQGTRGGAYMFFFDPTAVVSVIGTNQIGYFENSDVSTASAAVVGGSAELAAVAVFANWVKFSTGKLDLFDKVVGGARAFPNGLEDVNKIIKV